MWIYFYVSGKAIQDLGRQLKSPTPTERTTHTSLAATAKGEMKASLPKLFGVLGLGEAAAGVDANLSRTFEEKFSIPEGTMVDKVAVHLSSSKNFSEVGGESKLGEVNRLRRLLRFQGVFRPELLGETPPDQFASFEGAKYINWRGCCGEIAVFFTTSKESLITKTPIYKCLADGGVGLALEGFGIIDARHTTRAHIELIPLFFGVDLQ